MDNRILTAIILLSLSISMAFTANAQDSVCGDGTCDDIEIGICVQDCSESAQPDQNITAGDQTADGDGELNPIFIYVLIAAVILIAMLILLGIVFIGNRSGVKDRGVDKHGISALKKAVHEKHGGDYRRMVAYIKDSIKKGYDEDRIADTLVKRGMEPESVNRAIREARLEM
jgi:hypothetical protein